MALDVVRYLDGLDVLKVTEPAVTTPRQKVPAGLGIGQPRVPVPDRRREELEEPPVGPSSGAPDDLRDPRCETCETCAP